MFFKQYINSLNESASTNSIPPDKSKGSLQFSLGGCPEDKFVLDPRYKKEWSIENPNTGGNIFDKLKDAGFSSERISDSLGYKFTMFVKGDFNLTISNTDAWLARDKTFNPYNSPFGGPYVAGGPHLKTIPDFLGW